MEVIEIDKRQSGIKGTLKELIEVVDEVLVPSSYIRLAEKDDGNGLLNTPEKRKETYRQAVTLELIRLAVFGAVGYSIYNSPMF